MSSFWKKFLLPSMALMLSAVVVATDSVEADGWKLVKDKSGIQVYSKPVENSPINAVRAEMVVDSSLNRLVGILYDPEVRPSWDEMCGEAYFHKRMSSTEYLAYVHTKLPWPVKDREVIARVIWSQDPVSLKVLQQGSAVVDAMPQRKDRVRVSTATTNWELLPLEHGKVKLSLFFHADPAGPIPAWLINRLSIDSPYKMLRNIEKLVGVKSIEQQEFEFIQEPERI